MLSDFSSPFEWSLCLLSPRSPSLMFAISLRLFKYLCLCPTRVDLSMSPLCKSNTFTASYQHRVSMYCMCVCVCPALWPGGLLALVSRPCGSAEGWRECLLWRWGEGPRGEQFNGKCVCVCRFCGACISSNLINKNYWSDEQRWVRLAAWSTRLRFRKDCGHWQRVSMEGPSSVAPHSGWKVILCWTFWFLPLIPLVMCECLRAQTKQPWPNTESASLPPKENKTKQSSKCHICLLPDVENHYDEVKKTPNTFKVGAKRKTQIAQFSATPFVY